MAHTVRTLVGGVLAPAHLASVALPQAVSGQNCEHPNLGPSPYEIVRGWHQPFQEPGYAFGGNSGIFAETPDRIFVAM